MHNRHQSIEKLIHHIIVLWDECDHLSGKRSTALSKKFWAGYLRAFPEGRYTAESPALMVTKSPIFNLNKVQGFFHRGAMIPHKGENKDLAIAKFCTSGFIDQDEKYHFVIDDFRAMRHLERDHPMHANDAVLVAFITSDRASGMQKALTYVMSDQNPQRTNFVSLRTAKQLSTGDERMANAGYLLGKELKLRFVCIQDRGLLLKLEKQFITIAST
jgi:hypothetical protein